MGCRCWDCFFYEIYLLSSRIFGLGGLSRIGVRCWVGLRPILSEAFAGLVGPALRGVDLGR